MDSESFVEQMESAATLSVTVHYDSRRGTFEPLFGVLPKKNNA